MKIVGYVRVSAKDQNPARQLAAMEEANVEKCNIYMDKQSGKDFNRPSYRKMLKKLKKGDILIIKSIDRLGRNYHDILEQWRLITGEIGADIRVIDMPLLNTDIQHGDLTGVFISDLVLQILAYTSETERNFIKQRQAEGIKAAKERGVPFGCPRKENPPGFQENYEAWKKEEITVTQAAKNAGMSRTTFFRRSKEFEENVSK